MDTASPEIYTLSLHDALPISLADVLADAAGVVDVGPARALALAHHHLDGGRQCGSDRKSTRLNSSHRCISYAVFCLKKKKQKNIIIYITIYSVTYST